MMPRTMLAFAMLPLSGISSAAEIEHRSFSDGTGGITISGDIESADVERFRTVSLRYEKAFVVLDSPGGALRPAIEIGKLIRLRGYTTYVPREAVCTSSCALIWLAGSPRWLSARGRVGFHAGYRDNGGRLEESGVGNALIGNYLTLLNLSQKTVIFATTASPYSMVWLSKANAQSAGIEFEQVDFGGEPRTTKTVVASVPSPPLPKLVTAQPRPGVSYWFHYSGDTNGTELYYDANSVRESGNQIKVWQRQDHSRDRTVKHRQSNNLIELNCSNPESALLSYADYDKNGKVIESGEGGRVFSPLVPGSVGMALWRSVCGKRSTWRIDPDNPSRMVRLISSSGETEEAFADEWVFDPKNPDRAVWTDPDSGDVREVLRGTKIIEVTFSDGTSLHYDSAPIGVSVEDVKRRAAKDSPKAVVSVKFLGPWDDR